MKSQNGVKIKSNKHINKKLYIILKIYHMRFIFTMSLLLITNALININICGTGLYLPYYLGIVGCIKKHYTIDNYNITGTSGGAWCSLLYTQEKDLSNHDKLWDMIIGKHITNISLYNHDLIHKNIETNLKLRYRYHIPLKLDKISIIATNVGKLYKMKSEKISSFRDIDHLIDICSCSSYIPYISGESFYKKYNDKFYIDGQITSSNNQLSETNELNINKDMWGRNFTSSNFLFIDKNRSKELFEYGWEDTYKNRKLMLKYINKSLS